METTKGHTPRVSTRIRTIVIAATLVLSVFALVNLQSVYAYDPIFDPTTNLSSNLGNSVEPRIAASDSNVYVVWRDNNEIFFRASDNKGNAFDSTINLSNNLGVSKSPRIAASGSNVYVIWQDDTPANFDIFFRASSNNGTSFGSIINLSLDAGRSGGLLSYLELAASGSNVYAAWQDDDTGVTTKDILFRASNNTGTSFGSTQNLSGNAGTSQDPQLAVSGGNVYVGWRDLTPGNYDILFRASNNTGTSFGSTQNLSSNAGNSRSPHLAAAGSNVYAVWRDFTPGNYDILFRASNNNAASFGSTQNLSSNAGTSQSPHLAASGSNVYAAWQDDTLLSFFDIFFVVSNNTGTSFGSIQNLSNSSGTSQSPELAASASNIYAIWRDLTPGNYDILFRASDDNAASFGSTQNLSSNAGTSQSPHLGASGNNIYAAWQDNTPSNNDVFFRSSDDAPVADAQAVVTNEDTPVVITLTGSDIDLTPLAFSIVANPLDGTLGSITILNSTAADVTYTPDPDFNGTDSFTFKTNDGTADSNIATVDITVNTVNDAPVAVDDTESTSEDTAVLIAVLANDSDVDLDSLNVTSATDPPNGSRVINGNGTITYTPDPDYNGADSFDYTISDGIGSASATVDVVVNIVNLEPIAVDDSASTSEDTPVVIDVLFNDSDPDGGTLSVASVTDPLNGTAAINPNGTITYTPDLNYNGADSFNYTLSDGNGGNDNATVTITAVSAVNDPPTALDDTASTTEDISVLIAVLANDTDVDLNPLTVVSVTDPLNGTAVNNGNGTITYTPDLNYNGPNSFNYTITDGSLNATATVDVTVNGVSDPLMVKTGTFAKTTANATAIQSVTGVGFMPKALILFTTGQSTEGFSDIYNFAMGFSDGVRSRSVTIQSNDTATVSDADRSYSGKILRLINTVGPNTLPVVKAQAKLTSFDADGFTLSWVKNDSVNSTIHYIALSGPDLTAKVASFTAQTTSGNQAVTTVGFQPDFMMFMHAKGTTNTGRSTNAYTSVGFANSSTEGAIAVASDDSATLTDTFKWQRTNRCILSLIPNTGTIDAEASCLSMDPTGFTVNWANPPATADKVFYLALKGGNFAIGTFNQLNSTGMQNVTGLGFEPKGLMLASFGAPANTAVLDHNIFALGATHASGDGNERAIWVGDKEFPTPAGDLLDPVSARSALATKVIRFANENQTGSLSTVLAEADLDSLDLNGFTLNWTTADAIARQIIYIAFG